MATCRPLLTHHAMSIASQPFLEWCLRSIQPRAASTGQPSRLNPVSQDICTAAQVVVVGVGNPNDDRNPPAIYLLDPVRGNYTILLNNWFGQRFGGWDDVVVMRDG